MIAGYRTVLPASEIAEFEACLLRFPDRCVRLRVDRSDAVLPFATKPVPWNAYGRGLTTRAFAQVAHCLTRPQNTTSKMRHPFFQFGLRNIQAKDRVCDLCAAPGGKASACAEMLGPEVFLIANEAIRSRVDVLRYNLARTGRANYARPIWIARAMAGEFFEVFDTVLVDVPEVASRCSVATNMTFRHCRLWQAGKCAQRGATYPSIGNRSRSSWGNARVCDLHLRQRGK